MTVVIPEPAHQPSAVGGFLAILGWLGFSVGLAIVLVSLLVTGASIATPAPFIAAGGIVTFDFGASLFGGGLVLVGLGSIVRRLEVLCYYARLQAFWAQPSSHPDKTPTLSPGRREPTL